MLFFYFTLSIQGEVNMNGVHGVQGLGVNVDQYRFRQDNKVCAKKVLIIGVRV